MDNSKRTLRLLGQFSIFIGFALLIYIFWSNRLDIQQISKDTVIIVAACSNICIGSLLIRRSR